MKGSLTWLNFWFFPGKTHIFWRNPCFWAKHKEYSGLQFQLYVLPKTENYVTQQQQASPRLQIGRAFQKQKITFCRRTFIGFTFGIGVHKFCLWGFEKKCCQRANERKHYHRDNCGKYLQSIYLAPVSSHAVSSHPVSWYISYHLHTSSKKSHAVS